MLFVVFFVLLPTSATYHMTERCTFAAREHDSPVRLAVVVPGCVGSALGFSFFAAYSRPDKASGRSGRRMSLHQEKLLKAGGALEIKQFGNQDGRHQGDNPSPASPFVARGLHPGADLER